MSIHISGSTGFVGLNLKNYLSNEGYHILPIDLRSSNIISFPPQTKAIIHLRGKSTWSENSKPSSRILWNQYIADSTRQCNFL